MSLTFFGSMLFLKVSFMGTEHLCVLIHIRTKVVVGTVKYA